MWSLAAARRLDRVSLLSRGGAARRPPEPRLRLAHAAVARGAAVGDRGAGERDPRAARPRRRRPRRGAGERGPAGATRGQAVRVDRPRRGREHPPHPAGGRRERGGAPPRCSPSRRASRTTVSRSSSPATSTSRPRRCRGTRRRRRASITCSCAVPASDGPSRGPSSAGCTMASSSPTTHPWRSASNDPRRRPRAASRRSTGSRTSTPARSVRSRASTVAAVEREHGRDLRDGRAGADWYAHVTALRQGAREAIAGLVGADRRPASRSPPRRRTAARSSSPGSASAPETR